MTAEADEIGPARVSLPGIAAYLKSVYEIGRRSFRPGLPGLAFLFLCLVGMGAYGALAHYSPAVGKGEVAARAAMSAVHRQAAIMAAPLLFLVLIYIPFLPLQESLLRGRPIHFLGAIRRVLEESLNLMLSGIVLALILLGPILPFFFPRLVPGAFWELAWTFLALFLYALVAWMLVAPFFMIFAMPAVVLDGEGPLHSLGTSWQLVWRNLGSVLGRLLTLAILATVAYKVVTIPSSILGATGRTSGDAPIKLAAVIWESAACSLFFPFWVAGVVVLYRSLRPWTVDSP